MNAGLLWRGKAKLLGLLLIGPLAVLPEASIQNQGSSKLSADEVAKVHGRLFHKGPAGQIPDMLSKGTGTVHVPCIVGISQRVRVERSLSEELGLMASDSDLVVVGRAGAHATRIDADKDFLYTDWNVIPEEIIKSNPKAPVELGAAILVTRPGGSLQIGGRMVYADCADFLDFVTGQEYLLYLRFIPTTGAYVASGSGTFALSPQTKRLDPVNYPESKGGPDRAALLKAARTGAANSAQNSTGPGAKP